MKGCRESDISERDTHGGDPLGGATTGILCSVVMINQHRYCLSRFRWLIKPLYNDDAGGADPLLLTATGLSLRERTPKKDRRWTAYFGINRPPDLAHLIDSVSPSRSKVPYGVSYAPSSDSIRGTMVTVCSETLIERTAQNVSVTVSHRILLGIS